MEVSNGHAVSTEVVVMFQELLAENIRFTDAIVFPFWDITLIMEEKRILWKISDFNWLSLSFFQAENTYVNASQS